VFVVVDILVVVGAVVVEGAEVSNIVVGVVFSNLISHKFLPKEKLIEVISSSYAHPSEIRS